MTEYWTLERIKALKVLADLSTEKTVYGEPLPHKNWEKGFTAIKTENPAAYKMLKTVSIKNCKYAWKKFRNAAYGYCIICDNKAEEGEIYCEKCGVVTAYHRGIYSTPSIKTHMDFVHKIIVEASLKELQEFCEENILKSSFSSRRKLLGDKFRQLCTAKELGKKKEKGH